MVSALEPVFAALGNPLLKGSLFGTMGDLVGQVCGVFQVPHLQEGVGEVVEGGVFQGVGARPRLDNEAAVLEQ